MRKLTRTEKVLFKLTRSTAATVSAQLSAIKRAGLEGKSIPEVRKIQKDNFREWRNAYILKHPEEKRFPQWFFAAKYDQGGQDWTRTLPPSIHAGKVVSSTVRDLATDLADWGNLRKKSGSMASTDCRIITNDNGRKGWDRVVWHYAGYGSILSPDGKTIAVCVKAFSRHHAPGESGWSFHPVFHGKFMYRGNREVIKYSDWHPVDQSPATMPIRALVRLLRMHGMEAAVCRQRTTEDTLNSLRSGGKLYVVAKRGDLGYYHVYYSDLRHPIHILQRIQLAFAQRKYAQLQERQIERAISVNPFVCVEDSLAAGNCLPGTEQFRTRVQSQLGAEGPLGAVRADVLLSMRNDQYVRRAVLVAASRKPELIGSN